MPLECEPMFMKVVELHAAVHGLRSGFCPIVGCPVSQTDIANR